MTDDSHETGQNEMRLKIRSAKTLRQIAATSILFSTLAFSLKSAATPPLRDASKLWEARVEHMLKLREARVIIADYPLLRQDFPELATLDEKAIDKWLLDKTAFMSIQQVAQQEVNDAIPVTGEVTKAYRPREYGRANVFRAGKGLIDAKGSGGVDPHLGFERTGLATLGEMIREFMMEKLISKVFAHMGKYETVPCYAVLDLGFSVKFSGTYNQDVPAGMVLRRAHVRHHEGVIGERKREDPVVLPTKLQLEIELALREYGITSTISLQPNHPYHNTVPGDQLNIQGDIHGAVIDFAGFRIKKRFDRPIYPSYDQSGNAVVSDVDVVLKPGQKGFVQPNPKFQIPFKIWGNTLEDESQDNTIVWSEELAAALEDGSAVPEHAWDHYHNLLDPVDEKLKKSPRICQALFGD